MTDFKTQTEQYIEQINHALDGFLQPDHNGYDALWEAMRYSVMNAGKRVRPLLTLEFCRVHGGNPEDALPFACAVEMIHCYSLIHDDLPCMDDDDMRRGKPSCHKQHGESTALLAGDALLTRAFEITAGSALAGKSPSAAIKAVAALAQYAGVSGMIGGQVLDLSGEQEPLSAENLKKMHALKTGALIRCACTLGALCAGAGDDAAESAGAYGENLGLAFQMVDDILDVVGDEQNLGKPVGSDVQNGKTTFITLYGMEQAKQMAQQYTEKATALLSALPEHEFLLKLTASLLKREK